MRVPPISSLLAVLPLVVAAGCQRPEAVTAKTRLYVHPGLGVSFELPGDWTETALGSAVVFGGPAGTPAWYTTLTLQASPDLGPSTDAPEQLERVLSETVRVLPTDEPPHLGARSHFVLPATASGVTVGLRYAAAFDLYEHARLREGVLLRTPSAFVSLAYTAPAELFAESYAVFDDALATLLPGVPDGGQP